MEEKNGLLTTQSPYVDSNYAPVPLAAAAVRSIPSWITASKLAGEGNDTVLLTAAPWKGRLGRSGTVEFAAASLRDAVNCTQAGITIFQANTNSLAFAKNGETKNFQGVANLASITFETTCSWITLGKMTVSGVSGSFSSGQAITGDPGATGTYDFSIPVTAAKNPTVNSRSCEIVVNGISYVVTQEAGDATLDVTPKVFNFSADGGSLPATVTSNTSWYITT